MILSIITICYNSASTIENTIKSVLSQKSIDIEYIIIDGGSNDNTLEIIKKYDYGIDLIISEPDKGISDAFNKGISNSNGDYIFLLNSDDFLEDNILKSVRPFFGTSDILCFCMNLIDPIKNKKNIIVSDSSRLNRGMYVAHPATIVSKKVYEKIGGFNEKYKLSMDYEFLLRAKYNNFSFKDINIVITNMSKGGVSDRFPFKAVYECTLAHFFYNKNFIFSIVFYLNYLLRRIYYVIKE